MRDRSIRAEYDQTSITVYQAYCREIAESAVANQNFISPPFKIERMTWIKPSFLWMMYRSGWASKPSQRHILAIKIKREGFEWALNNSCLSHFDKLLYRSHEEWRSILESSPVRIQWDPERNIHLDDLKYRSIQIGLSALAVEKYLSEWIIRVRDITEQCYSIRQHISEGRIHEAIMQLPAEEAYPLSAHLAKKLGASS